jgi:cytochrome P450
MNPSDERATSRIREQEHIMPQGPSTALPTVTADTNDWDELAAARERSWLASSSRGYEVLSYREGHEVLNHPDLPKGPTFLKRLDALGITEGKVREDWTRIVTTTEGEQRRRLRIPLAGLFRPAQVAKLESDIRDIIHDCLDTAPDRSALDVMRDLAWRVPSQVYCLLVSAPAELAPMAARMSNSILTPLLTGDTSRRQESIDAFEDSLDFVREHIESRRRNLGDDFTSVMIRQQQEGMIDEEELVAEGASILQASIDNTAHQLGLMFAVLMSRPELWARIASEPSLIPAVVEEVIRLEPRFNTIFRHAPEAVELAGQEFEAGSWVYVSVRTAQRDPEEFTRPREFELDRPRFRQLMFGGGGYNCLGQHLARIEFIETLRAVVERFPNAAAVREPKIRYRNSVTEVEELTLALE